MKQTPAIQSAPTIASLEAHLDSMQVERNAAETALAAIPGREQQMLEADAPDSAFAAIDLERRRLHVRLSKIGAQEGPIRCELQTLRDQARTVAWVGFVDQYEAHARRALDLGALMSAEAQEMWRVSTAAQQAGFAPHAGPMHLAMPSEFYFEARLRGLLEMVGVWRRMQVQATEQTLYNVRFVEWTTYTPHGEPRMMTAYLAGQEAGFPADVAWGLVIAGKAEFTDPSNVPPRPAKKRKLRQPVQADDGRRENLRPTAAPDTWLPPDASQWHPAGSAA